MKNPNGWGVIFNWINEVYKKDTIIQAVKASKLLSPTMKEFTDFAFFSDIPKSGKKEEKKKALTKFYMDTAFPLKAV